MNKYPLRSEFPINDDVVLPLCDNEDYVYLLSGSEWKVLDAEIISELKNIFDYEFKELVYLPQIFSVLSKEVLAYNFPGASFKESISSKEYMQIVLELLGISLDEDNYAFLRYCAEEEVFKGYLFPACTLDSFIAETKKYLDNLSPEDDFLGMWSVSSCDDEIYSDACEISDTEESDGKSLRQSDFKFFKASYDCFKITEDADELFSSEQCELIDKAIDAVKQLQLSGISIDVIKKLLEPKVSLSRLVVTKRCKILLPDYDKEIKMSPLPKTIFLFFLKHDKEFMFSDLMDYKDEILRIYEKVSNRDDKSVMRESIERLVDPQDNSICEKCTAVRTAFMEQITYDVARNYFIEGKQGMPKRISLDRSLVEWEISI